MRIFLLPILLLLLASVCVAQRNPTMTSQLDDSNKEELYARFTENKKIPIGERQRLAYEAARDYVKRYSAEPDARFVEMRRFVKEYERVMGNVELAEAFRSGKYDKAFELGRAALKKDPENFYVLATLTQAGYGKMLAGTSAQTVPPSTGSVTEETIDYAKRAIAIAESEKFTQADPFGNVAEARGFLNYALGWFLRTQSPVEAAAALVKAVKSGSSYKDVPVTYNLLGIAILKGEYAQLSAEYNEKFGNKPPSPEQQAMWQRLVRLGERAIDAYARAVALSNKPEMQEAKAKMLGQLTQLYKSFHNNSDAGLSDLIANVLAKPLPE